MPRAYSPKILAAVLGLYLACPAAPAKAAPFQQVYRDKSASYILLFAFPSSSYIDWSNPSALARTALQTTLSKSLMGNASGIGHAQFAWHCRRPDGSLASDGATGQSGMDSGQGVKALLAGWGMSILELVYTDGHLESVAEVKDRISKGAASNQFSWSGFKVPYENCMAMAEYVESYTKAEAYKNYGFPVDPLKNEGGGCTSFAHAAVARTGLDLPFAKDWVREYQVAESHMGRSDEVPAITTIVAKAGIPKRNKEVPLSEFLFGNLDWARPGEPAFTFRYYDPELFYESFQHMENMERQKEGLTLKNPTRTSHSDPFQLQIKTATEQWIQQLQDKNVPMQIDQIAGYSGLIVDLRAQNTP